VAPLIPRTRWYLDLIISSWVGLTTDAANRRSRRRKPHLIILHHLPVYSSITGSLASRYRVSFPSLAVRRLPSRLSAAKEHCLDSGLVFHPTRLDEACSTAFRNPHLCYRWPIATPRLGQFYRISKAGLSDLLQRSFQSFIQLTFSSLITSTFS
jgi:hypothetical protein